ncbi:MAG: DUF6691 family protein [Acidimicrobiales bacterium]
MKLNTIGLLFGAAFGGLLAGANLHEYDTIHAMLALEEIDVFLLMASAIAVSAPLLWILERRGHTTAFGGVLSLRRSRPQKHHVQGGVLFGLGWAVAGTCPAPALVMISSGALLGLVAIPGIFLGLHLRERQMGSVFHVGDGEHRETVIASSVEEVASPVGVELGGCSGLLELPVDQVPSGEVAGPTDAEPAVVRAPVVVQRPKIEEFSR